MASLLCSLFTLNFSELYVHPFGALRKLVQLDNELIEPFSAIE